MGDGMERRSWPSGPCADFLLAAVLQVRADGAREIDDGPRSRLQAALARVADEVPEALAGVVGPDALTYASFSGACLELRDAVSAALSLGFIGYCGPALHGIFFEISDRAAAELVATLTENQPEALPLLKRFSAHCRGVPFVTS